LKSDVIYVSKTEQTEEMPPKLIEIQNRVDLAFIIRLTGCSTYIYERYRVRPIVLVFAAKGISLMNFIPLVAKTDTPFLKSNTYGHN
jgi:hypothetical protein